MVLWFQWVLYQTARPYISHRFVAMILMCAGPSRNDGRITRQHLGVQMMRAILRRSSTIPATCFTSAHRVREKIENEELQSIDDIVYAVAFSSLPSCRSLPAVDSSGIPLNVVGGWMSQCSFCPCSLPPNTTSYIHNVDMVLRECSRMSHF